MGFPVGAPLDPSPYVQAFSRYLAQNISRSRPWPFGVTWRHWSCDHLMPHIAFSYRRSIVTDSLSTAVFEILGPKHIGVTTLTFQSQVTSSITWRFDSPYAVSYWCSIETEPLSPSVRKLLDSKYIWITTLKYLAPNISGSRPWPFGVTWRHWSSDYLMPI